ncbi:MAG: hypothetical protein AAF721_28175 [Myxococcota bacterium]
MRLSCSPLRLLTPAALALLLVSPAESASAAPSARKPGTVRKGRTKRRVAKRAPKKVQIQRAHVRPGPSASPPHDPTPNHLQGNGGGRPPLPPGPGNVQTTPGGDFAFTLSANAPYVPFAGRISAHYPRDWETSAYNPGHVWISNHRLPGETYVDATVFVQPGYEYRVELCTRSNDGQTIQAEVGDTVHVFNAGTSISNCDLTLLLQSNTQGWTDIRLRFDGDQGTAFALNQVKVVRSET